MKAAQAEVEKAAKSTRAAAEQAAKDQKEADAKSITGLLRAEEFQFVRHLVHGLWDNRGG